MIKQFGNSSADLWTAIVEVIEKLCTSDNLSLSLESFLACRLIPLDMNSGHRLIGSEEMLRWIAGLKLTVNRSYTLCIKSMRKKNQRQLY